MNADALTRLKQSVAENNECQSWNTWRGPENAPVDLSGTSLAGANLAKANLAQANLAGANLTGANLAGANLTAANLAGAMLRNAKLDGAKCNKADFSGADITNALFGGADLSWAKFRKADLTGADYSKAKVWKTDFRDAKGAHELSSDPSEGEFLTGAGGAFSFEFNEERLDVIARKIGAAAGRQILLGDDVDPRMRVSLFVIKKTLADVLDKLCSAGGLSHKTMKDSFGKDGYYLSRRK